MPRIILSVAAKEIDASGGRRKVAALVLALAPLGLPVNVFTSYALLLGVLSFQRRDQAWETAERIRPDWASLRPQVAAGIIDCTTPLVRIALARDIEPLRCRGGRSTGLIASRGPFSRGGRNGC